jgi:hypothetical protein
MQRVLYLFPIDGLHTMGHKEPRVLKVHESGVLVAFSVDGEELLFSSHF